MRRPRIPRAALSIHGSGWLVELPVFFRTLSGQKPSREDLDNLINLLRERCPAE